MKTIILRKPKCMRSDIAMSIHLDTAAIISKEAGRSELTPEQQYEFLRRVGECLNRAAKAGGFFRTKDMIKWFEVQKTAKTKGS